MALTTVLATIAKAGLELKKDDDSLIIVEKNAVALAVAESAPKLSDAVIGYNHYLLRGDIEKKKLLLIQIADALEPKKKELFSINKSMTEDFFYLVNNMNIRHNNCDSSDEKNYNPKFDRLKASKKEEWYDLIYEQGLALFVLLEQKERNRLIENYKKA